MTLQLRMRKLLKCARILFDFIELIWFYPKMDALLDSLFVAMHDIRTCQKKFKEAYVIHHDWDLYAELQQLELEQYKQSCLISPCTNVYI